MSAARRLAALLVASTAVLGAGVLSPDLSPAAARTKTRAGVVSVSILSVQPLTPAITSAARPLVITVALRNTGSSTLTGVTLAAERGDPLSTQAELTASLADAAARTDGLPLDALAPASVTLTPGVAVHAAFETTTSTNSQGNRGLCLCNNLVYPIDVTAHLTAAGSDQLLGGARTYVPGFDVTPGRVGVTWVWPLIDRPHRAQDGSVFTDDDLASSVADGGRLDRALQVVERVGSSVPLTLVIDPELLDELQVMTGTYTVRTSATATVPGTGQAAASAWLGRLQAVLAADSNIDVELTPSADPDVTGLTQHDLSWSSALPAAVAADVATALAPRVPAHTLAWPPSDTATVTTLDRLVTGGADTVLLDGSAVRPSTKSGIPVSAARLRTSSQPVNALLTAPALQRYAQAAINGSAAALPALEAELAIRVIQRPGVTQGAVLAAPRYVDPSPRLAADVLETTSSSVFTQPVSADAAVGALSPSATPASVRSPRTTSGGLTERQLSGIATVVGYERPVQSLIDGSAAGRQVLATVPGAVQRSESAAWSSAGEEPDVGGGPTAGDRQLAALRTQLSGYLSQVSILPTRSGSYTLASGDAPLPISLRNDSALSMRVRVSVHTVGGLLGFSASDDFTEPIAGHSKLTIKIPTHVQRSGRIPVQAQLLTPDNYPLGDPVKLYVHSTVLGTIGVVITIAAGAVLVLALLVRYLRRVLRIRANRRAGGRPPRSRQAPEREPVA